MPSESDQLVNSIYKNVQSVNLIGASITVGVSGGPDSLAMLDMLHKISSKTRLTLNVAHLNHGIRGKKSEEDGEFVKKFCEALNIPCFIQTRDIPKIAKSESLSLETAARMERHRFLWEISDKCGASPIALGHTLDDQVESILMHLIRGSGLDGLKGMELMSDRTLAGKKLTIFRPLLSISRDAILNYCREQALNPRTDSTNSSLEFTRNSVRLKLIPILESYNPSVKKNLFRFSQIIAEDVKFLEKASEDAWNLCVSNNNGILIIDTELFNDFPGALAYRILRRAIRVVKGSPDNISQTHLKSTLALAVSKNCNSINLPEQITARKMYNKLLIHKCGEILTDLPSIHFESRVSAPGITTIPGWKIETSVDTAPTDYVENKMELGGHAWLDLDIKDNLSVRKRSPGDIFHPTGMKNTKKIQDFMTDRKIPKDLRDRIPLLVGDNGIAWIVGWRTADWATPTPGKQALKVKFIRVTE